MPDSSTSEREADFVCECEESAHSACVGEPFYKEHKGRRYCVLHFPSKEKSKDFRKAFQRKLKNKDFDFCRVWFPDEISFATLDFTAKAVFADATFSGAANFSNTTFREMVNFSNATFCGKADFNAASFTRVYFRAATFSADVDFNSAYVSALGYFRFSTFTAGADFSDVTFGGEADFGCITFTSDTNFKSATFGALADFRYDNFITEVDFTSVTFKASSSFRDVTFRAEAFFVGATFKGATNFGAARFDGKALFNAVTFCANANFEDCTFSDWADFSDATLADHTKFAGREERLVFADKASLDLQFARVDKPEHLSFHTLTLRPHWFVNVDARRFDFTNVRWDWRSISEEVENLRAKPVLSPLPLLAIACRHLAVNASENHRYEEGSMFRYMAMEVRRLETWRGFAVWRLSWWYWLASGYGERVLQAFLVLLGIWLVAGLLYTRVGFARWEPKLASEADAVVAKGDDVGAPLKFSRALTYSAGVMTLQKPEPRPATTTAQTVVLLETILGPIQAALLALAIRRKFMR